MSDSITLPAFAKINWSLRVLGMRADGYHELDTFFQTISLHDTITLTITDNQEIALVCNDPSLPSSSKNLAYRAAKALQDHFAPQKGVHIHLEKRIPVQAGLGGGSSDAAVTLIGLAHLWQLRPTKEDLLAMASTLGADV